MLFSSPLFLIGLVAVAVPIVVHLFNLRRYKKVYFSNVERLEELKSETRRKSTIRQLLILATRIMAIVFLVLAFARPVIPTGNSNAVQAGGNDVSIFLDNSFSMESGDGDGILLEKAKSKAREIVAAYGQSDRFQLLTCDFEGRHFHWLSKEEILLMIDEVEASSATPTLSDVIDKQTEFVRSGNGVAKQIFVISDFQAPIVDFDKISNDEQKPLPNVTLVPLGTTEMNNIYIDTLILNAPVFTVGSSVSAEVRVCNDGDENLEKIPITLYLGGRQRAIANVDIPSRGSAVAVMHFPIEAKGALNGKVVITDYPVIFDDSYYFSLNIREKVRGLLVEGKNRNEFLGRLFDDDSTVTVSTMTVQQMDFSRIEGNDFVILDELPTFTTGMAQALHTFVENGGTLVVIVADDADQTAYNNALSMFSAPQISGRTTSRTVAGMVNFDNPLYKNVFSGKIDDMEMPSVTGYHRLVSSSNTLREPVITLVGGDDYVCVTPCGDGRLYLVAAPLRDANTDFVRQALFVPTIYNMALYSVRPTPPAITLGQESPVPLANRYDLSNGSVRLIGIDSTFEEIPDIRRVGTSSVLIPHTTSGRAGNYLLKQGDDKEEGLSFNYSRLESQMRFLGREVLEQSIKDYNLKGFSVVRNVEKPLDTYLREQMEGHKLWRWCILLCLLMLLTETLLLKKDRKKIESDYL